jgi:hypothetical protein
MANRTILWSWHHRPDSDPQVTEISRKEFQDRWRQEMECFDSGRLDQEGGIFSLCKCFLQGKVPSRDYAVFLREAGTPSTERRTKE